MDKLDELEQQIDSPNFCDPNSLKSFRPPEEFGMKTYFVSAPVRTAHVATGTVSGPGYLCQAKSRKAAMTLIRHFRRGTYYATQDTSIRPIHPGYTVTV